MKITTVILQFVFGVFLGFILDASADSEVINAILSHDIKAFDKAVNAPETEMSHKEWGRQVDELLIKTGRKKKPSEQYKHDGGPVFVDKDKYKKMFKKEGREVLI